MASEQTDFKSPWRTASTDLAAGLEPQLAEVEVLRREIVRRLRSNTLAQVTPVLALACLPLAFMAFPTLAAQTIGFDLSRNLLLTISALLAGFALKIWTGLTSSAESEHRKAYKERVLPALPIANGGMRHQLAHEPDIGVLCREQLLPSNHDGVKADDELIGTHRALNVTITELTLLRKTEESAIRFRSNAEILITTANLLRRLSRREISNNTVIFDGIVMTINLPYRIPGRTAILSGGSMIEMLDNWLASNGRERVRLEDPRFEDLYQVWSTDQIGARLLLTPAWMERFLGIGGAFRRFRRPSVLVVGDVLCAVIPKKYHFDYFEPPVLRKPANDAKHLESLVAQVDELMSLADAFIDLDPRTAGYERRVQTEASEAAHAVAPHALALAAASAPTPPPVAPKRRGLFTPPTPRNEAGPRRRIFGAIR